MRPPARTFGKAVDPISIGRGGFPYRRPFLREATPPIPLCPAIPLRMAGLSICPVRLLFSAFFAILQEKSNVPGLCMKAGIS